MFFFWQFFCPFYLLWTVLVDTFVFITILCMQQNNIVDINTEEKHRMDIYCLVVFKDLAGAFR
jgi:hypothetical protein